MYYALLLCHDESLIVGPEADRLLPLQAVAAMLGDRLIANIRLHPTLTATSVQVRNGDVVLADRPFAETQERVAGLVIVECADLDEAIIVASTIPTAACGTVEIRPIWELN